MADRGGVRALHDLAKAADISLHWLDYAGRPRVVADDDLEQILSALGFPASTAGERSTSYDRVERIRQRQPALVSVKSGGVVKLRAAGTRARVRLEDGTKCDVTLRRTGDGSVSLRAPRVAGYHSLEIGDSETTLAVAPTCALRMEDITPGERVWGAAVQVYSLNLGGPVGEFRDLSTFCSELAAFGADAVAVSPVHALFAADNEAYAPYGPSSRLFLNPIYVASGGIRSDTTHQLIDWPVAAAEKMEALRREYAAFRMRPAEAEELRRFVAAGGSDLLSHARFEALDERFRRRGFRHWRDWPDGYADALHPAVQAMGATEPEVEFHLYLQWRADAELGAAQAAARVAGMRIGLIADLAVGMDGAGSHAWSRRDDVLNGLSVGVPPDSLTPDGQSWGLTTFSPLTLAARGFEPFLATLRAAMRHSGGVRIDHAMGLQRLWVSPEGEPASRGAFLNFPFDDFLRLIALESHRHRAIVIGEDLGTVPEGFRARSRRAGIGGMRVLWFERTRKSGFVAPASWEKSAVAMTTTHDLPTVAGWWSGNDIAWQGRAGQVDEVAARSARARDRRRLWRAMLASGAAQGEEPDESETERAVDATVAHIGGSACALALVALEDLLGLPEQPNFPSLLNKHPNWRRRVPRGNGLRDEHVRRRLRILQDRRKKSKP